MSDFELRRLDPEAVADLRPASLHDLSSRVALVTGAGGGIGSWLAGGLAAAGARVLLADHPQQSVAEVQAAIEAAGGAASALPCDLLEDGAAERLVAAGIEREGRIDVLVNNAGINRREPIFDVAPETWERIAALNLRIPFELSRAVAREIGPEGGSIIQIGSLNNAIGLQGVSVYGAHKAAICQLAKSMAVEWAYLGIRVNALCPGFMLTPLTKSLWEDPERGGWILERSPLRRPGYPRELVGTCQLLASDAGSFITGQTFYVDGGWLAGTPWTDQGGVAPDE